MRYEAPFFRYILRSSKVRKSSEKIKKEKLIVLVCKYWKSKSNLPQKPVGF